MTDNEKMREAFEDCSLHDGYGDDSRLEENREWFIAGWQAAKSVPQYDPSTAEVPPPGHPLQKLGEYLSLILDEDEWATAEQHLLAAWAGFSAKSVPVVGEPVAWAAPLDLERIQANNGCFIRLLAGKEAILLSDIPLYTKPTHSITEADLVRIRDYIAGSIESEGALEAEHSIKARELVGLIDAVIQSTEANIAPDPYTGGAAPDPDMAHAAHCSDADCVRCSSFDAGEKK